MAEWKSPDKPIDAVAWVPPDKPIGETAGEKPADTQWPITKALDPLAAAKTIIPPVVNFLDYPIRDLSARVVGAVKGGLPVDDASRKSFYKEYEKALPYAELPETRAGKAISDVASIPGQVIGAGVRGVSNAALGKQTTDAIAPYAGALADALPFVGGKIAAGRAARPVPAAISPTPAAAAARAAGYKLTPAEISDQPTATSRVLAGASGKQKTQQSLSELNQTRSNELAASSIGLPPATTLNEAAFAKARAPAVAAYDAIRTEIPETALGADPTFRQAVDGVGVRNASMQQSFPEAVSNPKITELRDTLLKNGTAPTADVIKKIADLRFEAGNNFRKRDDAQAHALGHAQRQAANVLEDAIEKSIGYGPDRVTAFAARDAAVQQVINAQAALSGQKVLASGGLPAAQAALDAASRDLAAKLAAITPADIAKAQTLRQQFQGARQLFAKTYDVEAATNLANGDVRASRLSELRRRGRPLSGELKSIADTYDAFPKDMQSPATFGRLEDWSVLDMAAAGAALAGGHPLAAAAVGGRNPARKFLGSDFYQNRMFNRGQKLSSPAGAVLGGELMLPENDPLRRALIR